MLEINSTKKVRYTEEIVPYEAVKATWVKRERLWVKIVSLADTEATWDQQA